MGEANGGKRSLSGMEKLSLETNRYPRDLLQRFMASNPSQLALTTMGNEEEESSEEIELNLGLSLGGRFGVDKGPKNKLTRSSSIAGYIPIVRDDGAVTPPPVSHPTLIRASSLPSETGEEWRKRKELQTLRRMEAKRRRSEKQRNMKGEKDGGGGGSGSGGGSGRSLEDERREIEMNLRVRIEREQYMAAAANRPPTWATAAARQALLAGGRGNYMAAAAGGNAVQGFVQPSGSIESQGGRSSSGTSESESRLFQGFSSSGEASPASIRSLQEGSNQVAVGSSVAKGKENACESREMASVSKRPKAVEKGGREMGLKSMEDMPCVFTQGDGPDGKRIEGILYKYGKGEEVWIMCVCHGSFLSPAEFVKHAGGGDVAYPLKHIVVNRSSSSFL